jgi:hypothetical protein
MAKKKPKSIRIEPDRDVNFEMLMDSLERDVVAAHVHWKLFSDLNASVPSFEREFNQAAAFWGNTINAHHEVTFARLGRLYDQHAGALSLRTWLLTVRDNVALFDDAKFLDRLAENPFAQDLVKSPRQPTTAEIDADLEKVTSSDDLVQRLVDLRNVAIAHRDPKTVLVGISAYPVLAREEIDTLLGRALEIMNRYSTKFRARTNVATMVGHDDYLSVLRLTRRGLDASEAEIDAESTCP